MNLVSIITAVFGIAVATSACASGSAGIAATTASLPARLPTMSGSNWGSIGRPGAAADVDETIEVSQLDALAFDPVSIAVGSGDTVEFVVTNVGEVDHEFVLGDIVTQTAHESEMAGMHGAMMSDDANAVSVSPGETKRLIWRFTGPGTVIYGCHVAGHYAAGMVGEILVAEGA